MRPLTRSALALALLTFGSHLVHAQTTALVIDSQPGDYIGQGQKQTWTTNDLSFSAGYQTAYGALVVRATTGAPADSWQLLFAAPNKGLPWPGVYENAKSSGLGSVTPVLDVSGSGRNCSFGIARFIVYELTLNAAGAVTRFAADFEHRCEYSAPGLVGAIRFNSARASSVPFDGAYLVYSLRVEPAEHGYVTASGIDCGADRADCDELYARDAVVALRATALPGYVFLGWAGDCVGDQDATIVITRRQHCAALFEVAPGGTAESTDFSQGALLLDGLPAVPQRITPPPGHRIKQIFVSRPSDSPIGSLIVPTAVWNVNTPGQVKFRIYGPTGTLELDIAAPAGQAFALGVPNSVAVMNVGGYSYHDSFRCSGVGRVTVHEYTRDPNAPQGMQLDPTVLSFAADFELPCEGFETPLAGSIRYKSGRRSLLPFDGVYPIYPLRVASTVGGFVRSAGIECGDGGRTDCNENYPTPQSAVLEAIPSAGYQFVSWGEQCSGADPTTGIMVSRAMRCLAVFSPTPGSGAVIDPSLNVVTLLEYRFNKNSTYKKSALWIGGDANPAVWNASPSRIDIAFYSVLSGARTGVLFYGSQGAPLAPGDYDLGSFSCAVLDSRFRIYELAFNAAGELSRFAADFEALCNSPTEPHLVGAIRWNSTRATLVPFEGDFPLIRLAVDPAVNGIVTGPGIDCGPERSDCRETYEQPARVTLQATPLPGYRFAGWTGACGGASTITIDIEDMRRCSAVFDVALPGHGTVDPRIGQAAFLIDSEAGHPVGKGRSRHVWLDVAITGSTFDNRRDLQLDVTTRDGASWRVTLLAPRGQQLQPGTYENALEILRSHETGSAALYVGSLPDVCLTNESLGRFVIHEISFEPATPYRLKSLAADFEHRCTPDGPRLRGAIRYHSTRSILRPFAPTEFTPAPTAARSYGGEQGGVDLLWRHTVSGRNALWEMNGIDARLMTALTPSYAAALADLDWEIRAVADMNSDDTADIVWQHKGTGRMGVWFRSGAASIATSHLYAVDRGTSDADPDWQIVAAGDMDRDGHGDLVWRHRTSGEVRLWHMHGTMQEDAVSLGTVSDTRWEIVALADMNQDGLLDLVWRHSGHGGLAAWFMRDAVRQLTVRLSPAELRDLDWRLVGVADINGDRKPDLFWQNLVTGELGVWFMDGVRMIGGRHLNPARVSDPKWRIVGVR